MSDQYPPGPPSGPPSSFDPAGGWPSPPYPYGQPQYPGGQYPGGQYPDGQDPYGQPQYAYAPPQWPATTEPDPPTPRDNVALIAAGVWISAATLAIVAPLLRFWDANGLDATGWGTYSHGQGGHGHDTNYGLPLAIAAALLVIAALGALARASTPWPNLVALAGSSLLVGVALLGVFDAESRLSFTTLDFHYTVEAGVWVMLVAGVVAVAAGYAAARRVLKP